MSLTDMVIMPGVDYLDACNAVREKTGGTAPIKSGEMGGLIRSISSGGGGGVVSVSPKAVNFRDYDGTVLHSYTKDEALALTALPELPTQPGLICQEWNWSLEDMQSYVADYGVCEVGATYITDDGKTRLYITIAEEGRMNVPLYFNQSVANGVTIDWGDGSATETLSGTGKVNTTHTYASIGDYVISLTVAEGCTVNLGHASSSYCVMGDAGTSGRVYCNMLQKVEVGNSVTSFGSYAFYYCYSLASVVIPNSVKSVGNNAFNYCYSLANVVIPNGVTSVGNNAFNYCGSLASVVIPNSVTSVGTYAFQTCSGMAFYDFTNHTAVPRLSNSNAFNNIPSDCEIRVPAALAEEWKAATNWSSHASKIVGV